MPDENRKPIWPSWETVRLIGRGSFGSVYEIERDMLGEKEKAALKVITIPENDSEIETLRDEGYDDASITGTFKEHLKRIVAEYALMRKLNGNTNVVNCDDVRYVQHDDGFGWNIYIKMELLTPMKKALGKEISDGQVIRLGEDVCRALTLCRSHSIVHRDIKPDNIFVSETGDYKLGDFGIAKTIEKTSGGTKIGTYDYMAPEVYRGQAYGSAADIYSLGMVLYWLLNERRTPFLPLPPAIPSVTEKETSRIRRFDGEPLPAPAHGSEELKRIVLKACAYDPKDRYQSAEEMLRDLEALGGKAAEPMREPPVTRPVAQEPEEDGTKTVGAFGADTPARPVPRSAESAEEKEDGGTGDVTVGAFDRGNVPPPPQPKPKPKSKLWPILVALAAVAVLLFALVQTGVIPLPTQTAASTAAPIPTTGPNAKVGDYVSFGSYEQDNNTANGKEPIEWLVLAKEGNRVLLISRYALDCQPYNSSLSYTWERFTWETCTLRSWLNESFLHAAFTDEERAKIPSATVNADKNPTSYNADPGNDTTDQVFLLSITEAEKYFTSDDARKCAPTAYAIAMGAKTGKMNKTDGKDACWWWLRSPGYYSSYASFIKSGGSVYYNGYSVNYDCFAVRPALWVVLGS